MNYKSSVFFQSPAVHSFSGAKSDYAHAICSMDLLMSSSGRTGQIEWLIKFRTGGEQAIYIDLHFANNRLLGFCGIDELPNEAVNLLCAAGYVVDKNSVTPF